MIQSLHAWIRGVNWLFPRIILYSSTKPYIVGYSVRWFFRTTEGLGVKSRFIKTWKNSLYIERFEFSDHACMQSDCWWTSNSKVSTDLLTLFHIQKICSRQLWTCLLKNMENFYNCRCNYWKKLKTLCQKEKLLVLSNFSYCHNVFKSRLLQNMRL